MLQKNFEFKLTKANNNKIQEKWTKLSFKTDNYCENLLNLLKNDLTNVTLGGQLSPLELVLEVVADEAVVVLGGPAVVHDGGDGEVGHLQSFFCLSGFWTEARNKESQKWLYSVCWLL